MNEHITEYLDYYLGLTDPKFAVLIRGDWGSGKTYFIKDYKAGKENIIYVSLNGVSSFAEIEDIFFQELNPMLASKGARFIGNIVSKAFKVTASIDTNSDGKSDGSLSPSLGGVSLQSFLINLENKVIIFDDLERCVISLRSVLGYINNFIEHDGLKVIILANENDILQNEEKEKSLQQKHPYKEIKEKVIGKSFTLSIDTERAFDFFVNACDDTNGFCRKFKTIKELIIEIFETSTYNNLRHLRQTITDFERFSTFLPENVFESTKIDLYRHIASLFFATSFELRKGSIELSDIRLLMANNFAHIEEEKAAILTEIKKQKYSIFLNLSHPVSSKHITEYLDKGIVDIEDLNTSIMSSNYFLNENTPYWKKLWYFFDQEDEVFDSLIRTALEKLENCKISDKYEVIQVVCVLLLLSKVELITETSDEIIKLGEQNIKHLKSTDKLRDSTEDQFFETVSSGLTYHGIDSLDEAKSFVAFVKSEFDSINIDKYQKLSESLMMLFNDAQINEFFDKILSPDEYLHVPILSYINPINFAKAVLTLNNKAKKELPYQFERRYKNIHPESTVISECDWLKELKIELESLVEIAPFTLGKYNIKIDIIPRLGQIIENLEWYRKQSANDTSNPSNPI